MTGIYYRVERDGKTETIELEYLTDTELMDVLKDASESYLISIVAVILGTASREELISIINAYRKGVEEHD